MNIFYFCLSIFFKPGHHSTMDSAWRKSVNWGKQWRQRLTLVLIVLWTLLLDSSVRYMQQSRRSQISGRNPKMHQCISSHLWVNNIKTRFEISYEILWNLFTFLCNTCDEVVFLLAQGATNYIINVSPLWNLSLDIKRKSDKNRKGCYT